MGVGSAIAVVSAIVVAAIDVVPCTVNRLSIAENTINRRRLGSEFFIPYKPFLNSAVNSRNLLNHMVNENQNKSRRKRTTFQVLTTPNDSRSDRVILICTVSPYNFCF